ncbi:MAG: sulfur carrier protein ThiS [Cognatishimia sp.]
MKITVNGEKAEVTASTLQAVLVELGHGGAKVATAVNEDFVPATLRETTDIKDGDRVEIVAPRQGG